MKTKNRNLINLFQFCCIFFFSINLSFSQGPDTSWTKTFGFSGDDTGYGVQQTFDDGYIIVGYVQTPPLFDYNFYLIKTDECGDTTWTRTFGGSSGDYGYAVQQTTDSGYVAAGVTQSFGAGNADYYVVKTDFRGNTLWTKTYGGIDDDYCNSIRQTFDGGYIIAGWTLSFGATAGDFYVIKTDSMGDTLWTRRYVGSEAEHCQSIIQISDSGYVLVGTIQSTATLLCDIYLMRTDRNGDTLWTKTFGGGANDFGNSVQQTSDGGFIIAGYTFSFGAGANDFYLIKTDANGNVQWTQTFGGSSDEFCWSVEETPDAGYILAGYGIFNGSNSDFYLIKTDNVGNLIWMNNYGGAAGEKAMDVQQTTDGRYIIVGATYSFGAGGNDIYLVKTGFFIDTVWTNTYGGSDDDRGYAVQQTADSSYIIVGTTTPSGMRGDSSDVYLVSAAQDGSPIWTKRIGGLGNEAGNAIYQTTDGGYIITGYTSSFGNGEYDVYLIKTNANGDSLWAKTYGGAGDDQGNSIYQTTDGGYIITGYITQALDHDVYLIKTNADGDTSWTKTFGSASVDEGNSVNQTLDGGYIITGYTNLSGDDNVYLIKTDGSGTIAWEKTYGSIGNDRGYAVYQTSDGGYIITGYTHPFDNNDLYLIKIDTNGDSLWAKTYGGAGDDRGSSVYQTIDGGYVITGSSSSLGDGDYDVFLVRTDSLGRLLSTDLYGGGEDDYGSSLYRTTDGGYIITGWSNSFSDSGDNDVFLIKTEPINTPGTQEHPEPIHLPVTMYSTPNPFKDYTKIRFTLTTCSDVYITLYNMLGQRVATVFNDWQNPGVHEVIWDGNDNTGKKLPCGIYFLKLSVSSIKGKKNTSFGKLLFIQ